VKSKEGLIIDLKGISTQDLGDSARPIKKWVDLPMGSDKDTLSKNITRPCIQPETGVVTYVDHGTSYT
jgi:hypothetical protein